MKNIIIIFFLLSTIIAFSQEVSIPFVEKEIKIDGKLEEAAWSEAATFGGFHNYYPEDIGMAKNDSKVWIYHNGSSLFIGAKYYDSSPEKMITSMKRDDYLGALLQSDAFSVVIDPFNEKNNGYYFVVNTNNTQIDALVSFSESGYTRNESWNAVWQSSTGQEGNTKVYELKIPLKALNFNPNQNTWGIHFIMKDLKINQWMSLLDMPRNYLQYDLRYTQAMEINNLPQKSGNQFILTPSITSSYQKDVESEEDNFNFKPSLDVQYQLNASLRLDATINPDFSQIDVDQQVTNLTRFSVNFPERRNFFLENADLFSNLGTDEENPLYTRRIGQHSDILFGIKLSGNVASKTRIGIMDVQTKADEEEVSQNFGTLVLQQQLNKLFTMTGFLVNRQEMHKLEFPSNYNRVTGMNLNFKSPNNKWTGLGNYGHSFSPNITNENNFYNASLAYNDKYTEASVAYKQVGKNYLTDIGFVPRLYNFDAVNQQIIREGYNNLYLTTALFAYPKKSNIVQAIRYFYPDTNIYWDDEGKLSQVSSFLNHGMWFKDGSFTYITWNHDYINLKYAFDILGNGNEVPVDEYSFASVRLGYGFANNKKIYFSTALQQGKYYNGNRTKYQAELVYRLMPWAKISTDYELNYLDMKELGNKAFHLARLTSEIFFNNQLNWTTYIQYNTQFQNFNINSRLQWEYKPLSYIYLVVTDNYDEHFNKKNWGVALKINYRFDW